jgi:hypothetical protein
MATFLSRHLKSDLFFKERVGKTRRGGGGVVIIVLNLSFESRYAQFKPLKAQGIQYVPDSVFTYLFRMVLAINSECFSKQH